MQLGVISDTHDNIDAINSAVDVFHDTGVNTVIHCGDYIAPPVIPFFDGFEFHGVLGNNDGELDGLERLITDLGSDSDLHGRYASLEFDGLRVFVLHGDQGLDVVEEYADSGEYDVVLYGHFHEAEEREVNGTKVINPGGHFPTVPAEHRSVVILDTDTAESRFVSV